MEALMRPHPRLMQKIAALRVSPMPMA